MSKLKPFEEAITYFEQLRRRFDDAPDETYWGKEHNATTREMIDAALDALRRAQHANEPLTNTGGSFNGTGNVYNGTGPCGNICVGTGGGDSDANV